MTILFLKRIDSTNKYALENLETLADKDLIISSEQTLGKGRNGNHWFSPKNCNIYASYIMKNCSDIVLQSSWIGGLAALDTLRNISNLNDKLWIKWPNDIFCENKKICGVLCESVLPSANQKKEKCGIIIGIGLNINCTETDLSNISRPCTSVLIETGIKSDLKNIYEILKSNLDLYYNKIINEGIEPLYNLWKKENRLLGENITVSTAKDKSFDVKVLDISRNGAIIGIDAESKIRTIYSGDVSVKKFNLKNY